MFYWYTLLRISRADAVAMITAVTKSLLFTAAMGGLWYARQHWYGEVLVDNTEGQIIIGLLVAPLWLSWSILANFALIIAKEKRDAVEKAVRQKDEKLFLNHANKEIPFLLGLILGVLALTILTVCLWANLKSNGLELIIVCVNALFFSLYREIALAFDNPIEGIWRVEKIPEKWLTKMEEEFGIKLKR